MRSIQNPYAEPKVGCFGKEVEKVYKTSKMKLFSPWKHFLHLE